MAYRLGKGVHFPVRHLKKPDFASSISETSSQQTAPSSRESCELAISRRIADCFFRPSAEIFEILDAKGTFMAARRIVSCGRNGHPRQIAGQAGGGLTP